MGDVQGFLKDGRELPARRPVPVRIKDWKEVYEPFAEGKLEIQASRCMDCGYVAPTDDGDCDRCGGPAMPSGFRTPPGTRGGDDS